MKLTEEEKEIIRLHRKANKSNSRVRDITLEGELKQDLYVANPDVSFNDIDRVCLDESFTTQEKNQILREMKAELDRILKEDYLLCLKKGTKCRVVLYDHPEDEEIDTTGMEWWAELDDGMTVFEFIDNKYVKNIKEV